MAMGACRDCKNCTNSGFAHTGRKLGRMTLAMGTGFMSEVAMATQKKCRGCGHQMSVHGVQHAPAAVPGPPPGPPPGWYYPEGNDKPARWWDGYSWR